MFAFLLLASEFIFAQETVLEIWEIQGDGLASPYLDQEVKTLNNVITAVSFDGFFMQCPDNRTDNDRSTSDGIKVFTGTQPLFEPTTVVTVSGTVSENNGVTQLGGALSITTADRAPLPSPTLLHSNFPHPDSVVLPDLEKVEGMLVDFSALVTGPSDRLGLASLTTQRKRAFREAGIAFPGVEGLPVWDGNPEIFWFDPDALGGANNVFLGSGMRVESQSVLTQSGDRYHALPITYKISGAAQTQPVRDKLPGEWTVGSLNLLQLSDVSEMYEVKLQKLSSYILEMMRAPDILAVQEVGDEQALRDLAQRIRQDDINVAYRPIYKRGNDGIHVAFLVKEELTPVSVEQLNAQKPFLSGKLHDRPPLLLTVKLAGSSEEELQVLNVHLRSRTDIEHPDRADFVRSKRHRQSLDVAQIVQDRQDRNLIVLGDFNAFEFSDGYVDVVNQICGHPSLGAEYPIQEIVLPSLTNLTAGLPPEERYSFVFQGYAELLDHCLSSQLSGFQAVDIQFARGNADNATIYELNEGTVLRSSDHDGFVLYLAGANTTSTVANGLTNVDVQFPNPMTVTDAIAIRNPKGVALIVQLFDTEKRVIFEQIIPAGAFTYTVYLPGHLPSGLFWITVRGDHLQLVRPVSIFK